MLALTPLILTTYYLPQIIPAFLSENLLNLSKTLHHLCLNFSQKGPYEELYQSISCGTRLPLDLHPLFANSGLIHLIIISGLHISLLYKSLNYLQRKIPILPKSLTFIFLLLYTFMLNVSAPALRAYCFQVIKVINKKYKLHWPPSYSILLSILLSLLFKPVLWASLSLLLSWVAIVIIYFIQQALTHPLMPKAYKRPLIKTILNSTFLYLFLFPILSQFNNIHPLSIVVQLLLAPLLLFSLIPLSIIHYFLFSSIFNLNILWDVFFFILKPLQHFLPTGEPFNKAPLLYFWIYALSLHFLLILFEVYNRNFKLSMKKNIHLHNWES